MTSPEETTPRQQEDFDSRLRIVGHTILLHQKHGGRIGGKSWEENEPELARWLRQQSITEQDAIDAYSVYAQRSGTKIAGAIPLDVVPTLPEFGTYLCPPDQRDVEEGRVDLDYLVKFSQLKLNQEQLKAVKSSPATSEADTPAEPDAAKPKKRSRKHRPKTDPKDDERIWKAWKTRRFSTYAELSKEYRMTRDEVSRAIDRHRKRMPRR